MMTLMPMIWTRLFLLNEYYDDLLKSDQPVPSDATLFYFGNDEDHDGAMKTGNVTVNLDGDSYSFKFSTTGGAEGRGHGITGIDDKKYVYKFGLKLKASSDDKYQVVILLTVMPRLPRSVPRNSVNLQTRIMTTLL